MEEIGQRILGINTLFEYIDYHGLVCESFRSAISFLDYDAVIIDTQSILNEYETPYEKYEGYPLISKTESHKVLSDFSRTKKQIVEMLNHGKNVFIILSNNEDCYIHTGEKSKNNRDIVSLFDVFSFIPTKIKPILIQGEKYIVACNPPYSTFFNAIKDLIYYEAYFEAPSEAQLLLSPNKANTISAAYKIGKGKLVLLPCCKVFPDDEDDEQYQNNTKTFLDALLELNTSLLNEEGTYTLPLWSNSIKLPNESLVETELEKEKTKLKEIEDEIAKKTYQLKQIKDLKRMITSSGSILEEIVKTVLVEIGFSLQKAEIGRSDLIASYGDFNIVAEIKGVTKSAAEKHAAQLEKWVSEYYEENNQMPKALLIENAFCETPLSERKEEVFPDQMLKYCEARGHALITTTQLLCMYIEIKKDPSCAQERITELLSCVGKYPRYLDYENFLEVTSVT